MSKLQVQNIGESTVVIKDPQGYSSFIMEIAKGQTKTADVTHDVIERLAPSLKELETPVMAGSTLLSGIRWSVLGSDDVDNRAEEEGLAGLPSLNELRAANYSTGGGGTDVVATGTALKGGQVAATLRVTNVAANARLDIAAVIPGAPSNDISVEIITPSSTLAVTVVSSKITVRPAAGGSTVAAIVAAINADATAKYMVEASVGVAGTINEAIAEQHLSGGVGPGVSLTLNGTACALTAISDTSMTFDIPSGISAASRIVPLEFRNGPHVSRLSVPVAA